MVIWKNKKNNAQDNKSISLILIMLMGLIILCVIWYAPEIILIMAGKANILLQFML